MLVGKYMQEEESELVGEICMQERWNNVQEEEACGLYGNPFKKEK